MAQAGKAFSGGTYPIVLSCAVDNGDDCHIFPSQKPRATCENLNVLLARQDRPHPFRRQIKQICATDTVFGLVHSANVIIKPSNTASFPSYQHLSRYRSRRRLHNRSRRYLLFAISTSLSEGVCEGATEVAGRDAGGLASIPGKRPAPSEQSGGETAASRTKPREHRSRRRKTSKEERTLSKRGASGTNAGLAGNRR